jgi:UDP-3-O-[3-hydroxymyristoyl] glucosamine N-acyltransferase
MIAHNAQVGPLCLLAGQVGLSGSVRLGAGTAMGGQSGVIHGVTVGAESRIGAHSTVIGHLDEKMVVMGTPSQNKQDFFREQARIQS